MSAPVMLSFFSVSNTFYCAIVHFPPGREAEILLYILQHCILLNRAGIKLQF